MSKAPYIALTISIFDVWRRSGEYLSDCFNQNVKSLIQIKHTVTQRKSVMVLITAVGIVEHLARTRTNERFYEPRISSIFPNLKFEPLLFK